MGKKKKITRNPGPKPEVLKIKGEWQSAVKKALMTQPPKKKGKEKK